MCFIIGMGRSGTTLLTNLLNQHPELVSMPENNFILFGKELAKQKGSKLIENYIKLHASNHNHSLSIWKPELTFLNQIDPDKITYQQLCKSTYLESCPEDKLNNIKVIIDKNPIYSLYIDDLQKLFPEAKFIVISRDPRDNFLSRKKHTTGVVSNWNTSLANAWTMYYQAILKKAKGSADKFHFITYENLTSNAIETMNDIQRFLGLGTICNLKDPIIDNMLDSLKKSEVSESSKEKIFEMHNRLSENINTKKIGVWQNQLSNLESWYIYILCSKTASKLGYSIQKPQNNIRKVIVYLAIIFQYPIHHFTHWLYFYFYYGLSFGVKLKIFK